MGAEEIFIKAYVRNFATATGLDLPFGHLGNFCLKKLSIPGFKHKILKLLTQNPLTP
jgi:hypothetical protein